jgi:hypothetical protein
LGDQSQSRIAAETRTRRAHVLAQMALAADEIRLTRAIEQRALQLEAAGIAPLDALHVASAEAAHMDFFLTCDDRLLRRSSPVRPVSVSTTRRSIATFNACQKSGTGGASGTHGGASSTRTGGGTSLSPVSRTSLLSLSATGARYWAAGGTERSVCVAHLPFVSLGARTENVHRVVIRPGVGCRRAEGLPWR